MAMYGADVLKPKVTAPGIGGSRAQEVLNNLKETQTILVSGLKYALLAFDEVIRADFVMILRRIKCHAFSVDLLQPQPLSAFCYLTDIFALICLQFRNFKVGTNSVHLLVFFRSVGTTNNTTFVRHRAAKHVSPANTYKMAEHVVSNVPCRDVMSSQPIPINRTKCKNTDKKRRENNPVLFGVHPPCH